MIRLLHSMSGPFYSHRAGEVLDDEHSASHEFGRWVSAGLAEWLDPWAIVTDTASRIDAIETAVKQAESEIAMSYQHVETAAVKPKRKRTIRRKADRE